MGAAASCAVRAGCAERSVAWKRGTDAGEVRRVRRMVRAMDRRRAAIDRVACRPAARRGRRTGAGHGLRAGPDEPPSGPAGADVVGIDISAAMLDKARASAERPSRSRWWPVTACLLA